MVGFHASWEVVLGVERGDPLTPCSVAACPRISLQGTLRKSTNFPESLSLNPWSLTARFPPNC